MAELLNYGEPALLDLLPEKVRVSLIGLATLQAFADGQLIQNSGDPKPGLSIIKSGAAHIGLLGRDGSFVTNSIFGPGHCFGESTLFTSRPRTHDVSASSNTQIYQISVEAF
jgi:CRP/FNR family transcriptional regulator, cyclic AMP receptor protein